MILAVDYVHDTFEACLEAANSYSEYPPKLPKRDKYIVNPGASLKRARPYFVDTSDDESMTPRKRRRGSPNWEGQKEDKGNLPDMELFPEDVKLEDIPLSLIHI